MTYNDGVVFSGNASSFFVGGLLRFRAVVV